MFWTLAEGGLARFDGTDRETFPNKARHVKDIRREGDPGFLEVGPDGSVWQPHDRCHGLARFDGQTWGQFLLGLCIYWVDFGHDGSTWVTAALDGVYGGRRGPVQTYVIAPGAAGRLIE